MKKYLKILCIFAFLCFNMQMFGQGIYHNGNWYNCFTIHFEGLMHPIDMECPGGWVPGGGSGPGTGTGSNNEFHLNIMTYNLNQKLRKPKEIIKDSGAEVVAIQEMLSGTKYGRLKRKTDMDGTFLVFDYCYNPPWCMD